MVLFTATRPVPNYDHREREPTSHKLTSLTFIPSPSSHEKCGRQWSSTAQVWRNQTGNPPISTHAHCPAFSSLRYHRFFSKAFLCLNIGWTRKDSTCHSMAGSYHTVYIPSATPHLSQKDVHNQTRTGEKPCVGPEHGLEPAAAHLKALVQPRRADIFAAWEQGFSETQRGAQSRLSSPHEQSIIIRLVGASEGAHKLSSPI